MLERFEASDEIERSFRPPRIFGNERIVGLRYRKSRGPQRRAHRVVSTAEVEHAQFGLMRTEQLLHRAGIVARPFLQVIGVERKIVGVVDARLEIRFAPIVECVREQKTAGGAAAIIDRYAR